ncbi:MAG: hypothetical protein ACRCYY_10970 [Trueperaceae bacterium]
MMKRFPVLATFALTFVLSGCVIEVEPLDPSDPSFTITTASFSTNHTFDLGVNGETGEANQPEFVICNNLSTDLIYEFGYTGTLLTARSYLKGQDTQTIPPDGDKTFSTSELGNPVQVVVSIPPNLAPKLMAPQQNMVSPNAIGVVGIIGYTTLHLDFPGTDQDKVSRRIAIVDNCS